MTIIPGSRPNPFLEGIKWQREITPRRFPPLWSIEESDARFIGSDAKGQVLGYGYFQVENQSPRFARPGCGAG